MLFSLLISTQAQAETRLLTIKPLVIPRGNTVKLKDFITNDYLLSESEKELDIITTPTERDKIISIIDFAYMLQQYKELLNAKITGPRNIRIRKSANTEKLLKVKQAVSKEIRKIAPWSSWEIDILYSSSDDIQLSHVGDFDYVEVMPYNNRAMLGAIQFKASFFKLSGEEVGESIINPVILKKQNVVVVDTGCKKGQLLTDGDIKVIPIWVGANKREYITDKEKCLGRELSRSLSAGDFIKPNDLMNPICARKGDIVWVEGKKGGLSIRLAVMAMQTGRKGDIIRFQNKSSKKIFTAKLTGNKRAVYQITN
jgi:flagella basal body P-ring formation protein FlgA